MKKQETPKPILVRLFKADRAIIDRMAKGRNISRAEVIRKAIRYYGEQFYG